MTLYYKLQGSVSQLPLDALTTVRMRNSATGFASAFNINTTDYPASNILVWVHSYTTSSKRRSLQQAGQNVELILGFGLVSAPANLVSNITEMSTAQGQTRSFSLQLYVSAFQESPGLYVTLADSNGVSVSGGDGAAIMLGRFLLSHIHNNSVWHDPKNQGDTSSCII